MTQQQQTDRHDRLDRLVEDYLGAVSYACADLPPQQRDELIEDLREHITAARGALYQQTEAAVRTILDRLGEPAAIAEEAGVSEPAHSPVAAGTSSPARRISSATLGMWLGFAFLVITVLVAAALITMWLEPPPPDIPDVPAPTPGG
jgi:uncharacterized membrane protein